MEFLYFLLTFIVLLLFPLSFHFRSKVTKSSPGGPLPPGRSGWPIIGESFEFLSTGWQGHPEKFITDRMSKFSPQAFRTSLMLEDVAVLCGSLGNKFLFSNENKLVQVWFPSSVYKIFPSTSKTTINKASKLRKMLPNLLKPEALHQHVPIMDHITRLHFASCWDNNREVVVHPLTKKFTFRLACKIFVSIEDPQEVERLHKPFEHIALGILSIPIDLPGTPFRRGINAANTIRKEIIAIIKQRKIELDEGKASTTHDILSHMFLTSDENGKFMEDYEVADKILGLLAGAHDTASSACTSIVKYLAELPEIYHGVYKEQSEIAKSKALGELLTWEDVQKMKYSWSVACEVLRLAPPLQGAFREAMTDFMYNGFHIPKGWKLYWNANSTHRNPEFFPDPQKFDPSRFEGTGPAPFTFVPFGGGPRMCPGQEYARLEILIFMHHLVTKYKWEKVIPDEKIVVNPMPSPAKGLPIHLYPHKD